MIRQLFTKFFNKNLFAYFIIVTVTGLVLAQIPWEYRGSQLWEPQSAYCRLYDVKRIVTVKGIVQRVEKIVPMKGMGYGIHIILKTDSETIPVHLGPMWYVEKQPIKLEARDVVEVTGSRVPCDGKPIILGAVVNKGGETVKFRELNGLPLWAGWGRH